MQVCRGMIYIDFMLLTGFGMIYLNKKMANTKSAQKALRNSAAKKVVNGSRKNRIRTFVKKVADAIKANEKSKAQEAFKVLESEIMRGVTKRVIKLNTAARKLSRLSAQIRKIAVK